MSHNVEEVLRTMLESQDVQDALRRDIVERKLDPELEVLLWKIAYANGFKEPQRRKAELRVLPQPIAIWDAARRSNEREEG